MLGCVSEREEKSESEIIKSEIELTFTTTLTTTLPHYHTTALPSPITNHGHNSPTAR
jgi:hypothetical protein